MFLALEGVDGSGKSTLADEIARELQERDPDGHHNRKHCGPLKRDPLDEYAFDVEGYRPNDGVHIVADRWHWGELVYGPIYRDESALDTAAFRWVELFLKARGVSVWHVTQDIETLRERLASRGEDFLEDRHVETVRRGFYDVDASSITSAGIVMPMGDTSEIVDQMITTSLYNDQIALITAPWPQYIGRHVPHTLLVGDQRGGKPPHPTEAPFMARGTSSGRFLLDALDDQFWRGVGIVNINETESFVDLHKSLSEPSIVALGREASDALLDLDIEHGAVPHPAYVRRFHSRRKHEYGQLISDASRNGAVSISWPS